MTNATVAPPTPLAALGRKILGLAAIGFGLATLFEGGHVLFGGPAARAEAGNVVPMVLMFNFAAAFAYVGSGVATLLDRAWTAKLAWALALATVAVFIALGTHVLLGGAYEKRTVVAMTLRSGFWVAQALLLPRVLGRHHE